MFAIGNDEMKALPEITAIIKCERCGKRHRVLYGEEIAKDGSKRPSKLLGFVKCLGKDYLVALAGKDIRKKLTKPGAV